MLDFFNLKTEAFGLEITDSNVRIIKLLKKKKGKILFSSVSCIELKVGTVKNGIIKDAKSLSESLKDAIKKAKGEKIKTKYAIAALPEDKAFLQVIQMPKLNEEDLKSAVIFEAENYIPLPLEKVYIDFQVIPNPQTELDHLDILVIAFPRETIDSYIEAFKRAELKPVALELESQAICRVFIKDGFCASPTLIIQIGDTKTNLIIYAGYSLRFTFSVPISNNYFVDTISKELEVDKKTSEILKAKYGIEKYSKGGPIFEDNKESIAKKESNKNEMEQRKIFEALIPGLVDFVQQVNKYINYYHTHASHEHLPKDQRMISKILLCGSGANLKGIDQLISLKFNLPVEIVKPFDNLGENGKKNLQVLFGDPTDSFSTVFGLAQRKLEDKKPSEENGKTR